jgi:hypothetical protein
MALLVASYDTAFNAILWQFRAAALRTPVKCYHQETGTACGRSRMPAVPN